MSFTYGAIHRPVRGIGHAPAGFTGFGEHPDFKFGTVTYNEPLSRDEQEHYSLVDLSHSNADIARMVASDMEEYAAEYIQEAEENPRDFEIAVGQRIDRMNVHAKRGTVAPMVLRVLKGEVVDAPVSVATAHIAAPAHVTAASAAPTRTKRPRRRAATSFKPKGGEWIRIGSPSDSESSVLYLKDHKDREWGVTANRNGSWRIRNIPSAFQDDERAYAEGHVDEDLPARERFTAAKKMARKHLIDLLVTLSEEG